MSQRILVADDDESVRRLVAASVKGWGYEPVLAVDGNEAWKVLSADDAPKVAILDWMMPGMDGAEVVKRVRKRSPHGDTFILMLTAKDGENDLIESLAVGADDYVAKPFRRAELEMRLRAGVRGRAARANPPEGATATGPGVGDVVGGRFRITGLLGEGGMGSVWSGEHVELGSEVAIKFMHAELAKDPTCRARFAREARATSMLRSEHVARVLDYGVTDRGEPYLVMERLHGETLGQAVKRRGPLPVDEVVRIVSEIAEGLDLAHAKGILHRDITPENIFLATSPDDPTAPPVAKLVDFGIAKLREEAARAPVTRQGEVIGTLEYMSSEQLRGEHAGPPADLWSLGACAFYALTGMSAFEGKSARDIVYRVCFAPIPSMTERRPDLPSGLDGWFARACAVEADDRFRSSVEMATALVEATTIPAAREPSVAAEPRRLHLSAPSAVAIVSLAVGLVAGSVVLALLH